ncbi:MAG: hypothetical protein ABSB76_40065 [Streptosporangiaceae bacterium]|jgi:NAD(P)-dependent dehydrogenase (short-subunit alcohol dehydrogenase family)
MGSFAGRVAVVTGGAGGIGRALAPVGAPTPRRVADEIIRSVLATTPH